jgi:phosphatidylserine/phosphatidylglycerophosphate/cardiolipin synthase-like enzyme
MYIIIYMTKSNLNKLLSHTRKRTVCIKEDTDMRIAFDTETIQNLLIGRIKRADTKFVMGCAAWFTNTKIIRALSTLRGVSIICTRDKVARTKSSKAKYKSLPKHDGIPTIRLLGCGRGRSASLMHHKFLVGMDESQAPIWVSTGSFNLTESATNNIENLMIIENRAVAMTFLQEFQRLYKLSKPLPL